MTTLALDVGEFGPRRPSSVGKADHGDMQAEAYGLHKAEGPGYSLLPVASAASLPPLWQS